MKGIFRLLFVTKNEIIASQQELLSIYVYTFHDDGNVYLKSLLVYKIIISFAVKVCILTHPLVMYKLLLLSKYSHIYRKTKTISN